MDTTEKNNDNEKVIEIKVQRQGNRTKNPPKQLYNFRPLPRNRYYPKPEPRLRLIKYNNSGIMLDVRNWINTSAFTGYTGGMSFTFEQLIEFQERFPDIISTMIDLINQEASKTQPEDEVIGNIEDSGKENE